ncbi:hypothetical protein CBR_g61517 [Chara braunii]|uniref:Uncharacterized protein n=1 Tax=Chara braunii TaxID=69332 RepID=A0A388K8S4_CHABU|nr:hypothetical protein CBR_g61517 [Chara braunii]|eukprot:GBG66474.1 hypothetical protein CBR_g61517 [Chara braunii]
MAPLQPSPPSGQVKDESAMLAAEEDLITVRRVGGMDGVSLVTMNRPGTMNALTKQMRSDLARAFRSLREDLTVRAVIVTGSGRAFCSGLDPSFAEEVVRDLAAGLSDVDEDPVAQMDMCGFPIIGAINGPVFSAGLEIALACDILVASAQARFADTSCKLGVSPGGGISQKLPRLIGPSRAREFSLTSMMIDGVMAERWGLVSRVVPPADLLDMAKKVAAAIASNQQKVVRRYKSVLNDGLSLSLCEGLKLEREHAREYASELGEEELKAIRIKLDSSSLTKLFSSTTILSSSGVAEECETPPMGQAMSSEARSLLQRHSSCPSTSPSLYQSSPLFGFNYPSTTGYCMNPYLNPYLSFPQAAAQVPSSPNPSSVSALSAPFRTPPSPPVPTSQWLGAEMQSVRSKVGGTKDGSNSGSPSLRRRIPAATSAVRGVGPAAASTVSTAAPAAGTTGVGAGVTSSTVVTGVAGAGGSVAAGGSAGAHVGGDRSESNGGSQAALAEDDKMNGLATPVNGFVAVIENGTVNEDLAMVTANGTAAVPTDGGASARTEEGVVLCSDDPVVGQKENIETCEAGVGLESIACVMTTAEDLVMVEADIQAAADIQPCNPLPMQTVVQEGYPKDGPAVDVSDAAVQGPAQDVGTQTPVCDGEGDEREDGQNNSALSRWSRAVDGSRFWWSEERVIMLLEAVRDVNMRLKKRRGMVTSVRKWECVVELTKFPLTATQHENKYNNLKKPYQKYKLQLYRSEMGLIADEEVEDLKKPSYYDVLERYLSDKVKLYPPARKPGSVSRGVCLFSSPPPPAAGKPEKLALQVARPLEMAVVAQPLSDGDDEEGAAHAKQDDVDRIADHDEVTGEVSRETSGNSQEDATAGAADGGGGDGTSGGAGGGSSGADDTRPTKRPRLPLTETIARNISRLIQQREKENIFARQRDLQFSQEIDSLQRELANALRAANEEAGGGRDGGIVEGAREGWAVGGGGSGVELLTFTREEIQERENALREREKELREREQELRELQQLAREREEKVRKGLLESSNQNLDKMLSLVERM